MHIYMLMHLCLLGGQSRCVKFALFIGPLDKFNTTLCNSFDGRLNHYSKSIKGVNL